MRRTGREFTAAPQDVVRIITALHKGALVQRYLEPDLVPQGRLERLALPVLPRSFSRSVMGPVTRDSRPARSR